MYCTGTAFYKSVPILHARYYCPSIKEVGRKSCKVESRIHKEKFYNICGYLFCERPETIWRPLCFLLDHDKHYKINLVQTSLLHFEKEFVKVEHESAIRKRETTKLCYICTCIMYVLWVVLRIRDVYTRDRIRIFPFRIPDPGVKRSWLRIRI